MLKEATRISFIHVYGCVRNIILVSVLGVTRLTLFLHSPKLFMGLRVNSQVKLYHISINPLNICRFVELQFPGLGIASKRRGCNAVHSGPQVFDPWSELTQVRYYRSLAELNEDRSRTVGWPQSSERDCLYPHERGEASKLGLPNLDLTTNTPLDFLIRSAKSSQNYLVSRSMWKATWLGAVIIEILPKTCIRKTTCQLYTNWSRG